MIPPILGENANFRRYFIGQSISMLGDQVTLIALPLTAVLALHASPAEMGALLTVGLIPNLLFSLHAGVWVDRRGRRRQVMLATDLGRGALIATVPLAYALGHLTWAHLYVVAFLSGTLSVFFFVAYGAFTQVVVPREDYVAANSLIHGSRAFSFLAGTSLGGVLVQLLRGPYALALDAVSYVLSAFYLGRIDAEEPPGVPHEASGLMSGVSWIWRNAVIRAELFGVATLNLFNFMFFALFLLYATRELGVRPATLGIVLGAASIGTLSGSFVTARISRRIGVGPTFIIGCFLFPAPLILIPAAGGPHWLVLALLFGSEFLSGVGLMLLDIMAGTIIAGTVPTALRSRVSGAFMVVNYGVRPVGTTLGGLLGTLIGVRSTLWIATVGALLGLAWLLPSPIPRLRDVPAEAPE
ncbi:MAG TPA: MFS transporter [Gaiellaceae bacterium]|nr:MFS transporter [Gaiellaceae bacterium]